MKLRKALRRLLKGKGAVKAPVPTATLPCPTGQGLSDAALMRRIDPIRTLY